GGSAEVLRLVVSERAEARRGARLCSAAQRRRHDRRGRMENADRRWRRQGGVALSARNPATRAPSWPASPPLFALPAVDPRLHARRAAAGRHQDAWFEHATRAFAALVLALLVCIIVALV